MNGLRWAFADWPYAMPERATPADYTAFLAHRHQRSQRYGVDVDPSLFELTHFALAHARSAQPQQALALACELAQRWGDDRRAFGALSRIGDALPRANGVDAKTPSPEALAAARTVYRLALASAPHADVTPQAIDRVRQRVLRDGGPADEAAVCARSLQRQPG